MVIGKSGGRHIALSGIKIALDVLRSHHERFLPELMKNN